MSKQKRPDTYETEVSETPKHSRKKVRKTPKKKKTPPKSFTCPFCDTKFKIPKYYRRFFGTDGNWHGNWKCLQCGGRPWGYKELIEEDKRYSWLNMYRWVPHFCTFCGTSGYDVSSKDYYFRLWVNDTEDLYCDYCKFRGKIGGGKK